MHPIVEISSIATVTALFVALFKLALPTSPSWGLVIAALVAGVVASFLVSAAGGVASWGLQTIATAVLQGFLAAAAAAGVTRTDERANVVRKGARVRAASGGPTRHAEPAEPPRAV
jgi:hypothetical protein